MATLTAALFVADILSPVGFGVWILYIVVVLLAAQRSEANYNRAVGVICTLLIIIGFFFARRSIGVSAWIAASSRSVGILAVWITSFLATQCTKAENRERTGRRLLRTTLMSVGDGVVATDAGGRVAFMNPVAEKLVGRTTEEAAGRPLLEIFHIANEETRREVENPALRALTEGVIVGQANVY